MQTISQKIIGAIKRKGFSTIKECAQNLDLPYELLRKVVGEDHIPKDNQLLIYANKLGIDANDLLFTAYYQKAPREFKEYFETNVIKNAPVAQNKVPVIQWDQAAEFLSSFGHRSFDATGDYVVVNIPNKYLFSLKVKDDSMAPFFLERDIIIINPNIQPKSGDYIVIKKRNKDEVLLRQLREYKDVRVLHSLNPKYEDQPMNKETHVLGRVVRKQMNF